MSVLIGADIAPVGSAVPLFEKSDGDGLLGGAEEFGAALAKTSALCLEVADKIIREL